MQETIAVPSSVSLLVAMQFAAFGWRVNREIAVGDKGEKTWVPLADILNILNFFLTTFFCIVVPIVVGGFGILEKAFLAAGFTLMFFHPFNMLGHYELLTGKGRVDYTKVSQNNDKSLDFTLLKYCPIQEQVMVLLSFLCASFVWFWALLR